MDALPAPSEASCVGAGFSPTPATPPAGSPDVAELLRAKLDVLRGELFDHAFELERCGRVDAADVIVATAGRVGELCAELALD